MYQPEWPHLMGQDNTRCDPAKQRARVAPSRAITRGPVSTSLPTKDEKIHFGERLRQAREARGMTQPQLAAACGVGVGIVSTWENGHRTPMGRVPWLLHRALGQSAWESLWGDVQEVEHGATRLMSEREIEAEARVIAQRLLAETIRNLGPDLR